MNALESAKVLYRSELYDDSISRAYYSILHAARAVLLTQNLVTKSHSGLQRLFGQYFVLTGELEKEYSNDTCTNFSIPHKCRL